MYVRELPLADRFVDHYVAAGIEELYPPQAAAIEAGVADGESVLAAVPTAGGKTFVAEVAMLSADGPALFVVPLRALATEKGEAFADLPGVDVGIATGDYDTADEELGGYDIVVATGEKVDSAIRNGATWIESLACVVVDEIHLLNERERGPTLEVTLAKLRRLLPGVQIVGLSATVGNAAAVADWLDAALVDSDWRPVDLRTGVYDGRDLRLGPTTRSLPAEGDPTATLVADALADGGGCLVFVSSRRAARELAGDLVDHPAVAPDAAPGVRETIAGSATTAAGRALAERAGAGIGFHHAGLRATHRSAVETAFRDRELAVVCATPTLAAGVNVPARRVVVRDHERYDPESGSMEPLSVLEVHQMFGRAGRPGLDPYGEAVLIESRRPEAVADRYLGAEPEPVTSKLTDERALRTHVLASVASGFADTRTGLRELLGETFYARERDTPDLTGPIAGALATLGETGMVDAGDRVRATDLGRLISRIYVDPATGEEVVAALRATEGMERVDSLTVLEIVCSTPDMHTAYVRDREAGRLTQFARRVDDRLVTDVESLGDEFAAWLPTLKTARLLDDYAEGDGVDELCDRYGVGPGDVRHYVERAEWLLSATESLADHLDVAAAERVRAVLDRLAKRDR
ncbi:DEAD/DEAH box helicase [Halobacteriales archaeon SW_7_68_16]|nr:MAG: DEAD/DEAH box helicase [Halobacteriales archaeon SW_7_68_16]